jgi:hypothetical protein
MTHNVYGKHAVPFGAIERAPTATPDKPILRGGRCNQHAPNGMERTQLIASCDGLCVSLRKCVRDVLAIVICRCPSPHKHELFDLTERCARSTNWLGLQLVEVHTTGQTTRTEYHAVGPCRFRSTHQC